MAFDSSDVFIKLFWIYFVYKDWPVYNVHPSKDKTCCNKHVPYAKVHDQIFACQLWL